MASERISLERNIERLQGLWPSAGLTYDWIALFRKTFREANQHWLAEAMEEVKKHKSSHVPELKWFIEEFHEVRKRFTATERNEPRNADERARKHAEEAERHRVEVAADRLMIRRQMSSLSPACIDRIKAAMQGGVLHVLLDGMSGPLDTWPDFSRGMAHAIAVRDGMIGADR